MSKSKGFLVKRPIEGKRASYSIVPYVLDGGRRKYQKTLKNPALSSINDQLRKGQISLKRAEVLVQELVADLYTAAGNKRQIIKRSELLQDNQRVLENFWDDEYSTRILEDEASARGEYERALKYLGDLPIAVASRKDMHSALKVNTSSEKQWRRAALNINILLGYLGREDAKLHVPKEDMIQPTHITLSELKRVLKHTPDPELKLLITVLFCTGARISEALAITPEDVKDGGRKLYIGKQYTRKKKLKKPKRERVGNVAVISFGRDALVEWAKVEDKGRFRYSCYKHVAFITRRLWPNDPIKHLSPHGLRHSHAIHLLEKGIPLERVAQNLRNRIEVCQRYYTGYIHTDSSLDALTGQI